MNKGCAYQMKPLFRSIMLVDDEKNLIERAKQGDSLAFGALYDHYLPQIYRFVYFKVSHREEAEDITHLVFMKAWQNIAAYIERGFPFSSWLYQISRNQIIDHYRQKKPVADLEAIEETFFADLPSLNTDNKFDLFNIRKALLKLTEDQRDVIIMHFIDDTSIKDVAIALNKTEGAVRLLQHRALQSLKRILKKDNEKSS